METTEATHPAAATLTTPVGIIAVTSTRMAIVRVEWVDADSEPTPDDENPLLTEALGQLRAYFDGRLGEFDLPLSLDGISPVATTVLTVLADTVDYGATVTYGELAARSGTGIPARAIGSIMGLNPLPLLIPCHRVVAGDGLGGYSGGHRGVGLATKRRLLELEGALPSPLF
ncbi:MULTISPECIES: methylated-DNA--[protein]-cysteine S-methyltransferase [unclassified Brevibacterium]|uniref:methylated-DNA--[protein]-cysteine S-methyltransferase n=1 Tax=unclassified Brevibacterium TaxID=2614124 RepID=UPI0010F5CDFD|nr:MULTISPECIES: methylated-DNA--[protein]-cysteine S-methyltransferase [unclassified Brevibacterium]MCM1011058.1 methylated-DNA--[protein]-cysteine S-methyltransferase [Brevibacterium sp. XM4083]